MRRLILFAVALLLGHSMPACAATNDLWFPVGEKLTYSLYWGVIPVGEAAITTAWTNENGRQLLVIRLTARSGRVISALYPVDDVVESVVDPGPFLPVRYTQSLREGRKVRNDFTVFDHKNGKAYWQSKLSGAQDTLTIDKDTRDVLSLVYYMRSKGFRSNRKEKFRVLVDEKLYDLLVTGLQEEETRLPGFGKVRCLEVKPEAKFGEIFMRKGSLNMWFSLDSRKILTKAVGKVPLAKVRALLRRVEGPGNDSWIKASRE